MRVPSCSTSQITSTSPSLSLPHTPVHAVLHPHTCPSCSYINIPRMLLPIIIYILCFLSAFIAFSQVSFVIPSLISFRCTKCHLVRKALAVHSTYNGAIFTIPPSPFPAFQGSAKSLHTKHQKLFVHSLSSSTIM